MTPRERAEAPLIGSLFRRVADALGYTCAAEDIENPELDILPVIALIDEVCAEQARALEARLTEWEGDKPTLCRLDKSDCCATILACHEVCQRFAGHTDLAPIAARERAKAARKLLDVIQFHYSRLNIYEFHKRREDVIEAAITEHVRALLADDEAMPLAPLIREEIVRQYRDNERQKCNAGAAWYEKNVAPLQIAEIVLAALRRKALRK